jgi:hypothetical protein
MYMLVTSPKSGEQKTAFEVLDEVFGTGEFTEGQGVNSIAVGLEVDDGHARTIFSSLVRNENIGEV